MNPDIIISRTHRATILMALALALACFYAHSAHATDTDAPTPKLEWVYQGAAVADMLTTLDIRHHPASKVVETNPILGQRPSDGQVLGYFVATGALHYLVTRELVRENVPSAVVNAWEGGTIGLELGMVGHNYAIGLHARF